MNFNRRPFQVNSCYRCISQIISLNSVTVLAFTATILWKTEVVSGRPRHNINNKLPEHPCSFGKIRDDVMPMDSMEPQKRMNDKELNELKEEFEISVNKSWKEARNIKNDIRKKVLKHNGLKKECKSKNVLRGMPLLKSKKVFKQHWLDILPDDYRRLTILSVFVYEAIEDADQDTQYSKKLKSLLKHLTHARCFASQMAYARGKELDESMSPAVMPPLYKNMANQAIRDRRNCIIAASAFSILSDMRKWYKTEKEKKKEVI